jgi:sulfhydrogenase subunit beta (sulfur reductase)
MKRLTHAALENFLAAQTGAYDVHVPLQHRDGTRLLGRPGEGPLDIGPLPRKPVEVFFPQQGLVFTAAAEGMQTEAPPAQPFLVVGFTAADLRGLAFTDRFFAASLRDDIYFRRREGAVIVGIAGNCGAGGEWLPLAGGGCDLELIADAGHYWLAAYSETGRALAGRLPGEEQEMIPGVAETGESAARQELLRQASALLLAGRVPDAFWAEIGERCIACTGCNLVCPTCTCFGVEDRCWPQAVERGRLWDSCQLDGFMREASGHNPLGSQALRTRRRIHHKLAADVVRWGEISCVACGRCERACPTGIGMYTVAQAIVTRFGR